MGFRIGHGFDVHRLAEGEELWLGGIKIPHYKGTIAHSDGDVLIHAMCDALLGAAKLRILVIISLTMIRNSKILTVRFS